MWDFFVQHLNAGVAPDIRWVVLPLACSVRLILCAGTSMHTGRLRAETLRIVQIGLVAPNAGRHAAPHVLQPELLLRRHGGAAGGQGRWPGQRQVSTQLLGLPVMLSSLYAAHWMWLAGIGGGRLCKKPIGQSAPGVPPASTLNACSPCRDVRPQRAGLAAAAASVAGPAPEAPLLHRTALASAAGLLSWAVPRLCAALPRLQGVCQHHWPQVPHPRGALWVSVQAALCNLPSHTTRWAPPPRTGWDCCCRTILKRLLCAPQPRCSQLSNLLGNPLAPSTAATT